MVTTSLGCQLSPPHQPRPSRCSSSVPWHSTRPQNPDNAPPGLTAERTDSLSESPPLPGTAQVQRQGPWQAWPKTLQHGQKQKGAAAGCSRSYVGPQTSPLVTRFKDALSSPLQAPFPQGLRHFRPLAVIKRTDPLTWILLGWALSGSSFIKTRKVLITVPSFRRPRSLPAA